MGHKSICLNCRKAFNQGSDFKNRIASSCPDCGQLRILVPHRFRPPKTTEIKKWEVIKYLIDNGFRFQHIKDIGKSNYVAYPETMKGAIEFVIRYKDQSIDFNNK